MNFAKKKTTTKTNKNCIESPIYSLPEIKICGRIRINVYVCLDGIAELSQVYEHLQTSALNVDDTKSSSIYMANDESFHETLADPIRLPITHHKTSLAIL
uniref:Uncharacterized protein n=1 Tax=Glossina pallidipes TaxID=7398 RepID=A0A1A9ZEI5_GLOPL